MTTMNMPGFTAETSLYKTSGHYRSGRPSASLSDAVIPAAPKCSNCDEILDLCDIHHGRPRAVCNACAIGYCYEEPPLPDPFPDPFGDPFGPRPRF